VRRFIPSRSRLAGALFALLAAVLAGGWGGTQLTVPELKTRLANAGVGQRPKICVEIAQLRMADTDKLYSASDIENAQAALADVVAFSELARDYAIQSHKHQKQTEIAVREMTRRLIEIKRSLDAPDQAPVGDAINRLQRVRDDLLTSMFPKGER